MIGQSARAGHDGGRGHAGGLDDLQVERRAVREAVIGRGGRGQEGGTVFGGELERGLLAVRGAQTARPRVAASAALLLLLLRAVPVTIRVAVRV